MFTRLILEIRINPVKDGDSYASAVEDYVFLILFSVFTFVQVVKSIISKNIFGFDLSIILMIHNFIFVLLYELVQKSFLRREEGAVSNVITICVLYLLESLYSLFMRYNQRNEINLYIFKRIGSNPKINGKCNFIII